MPAILSKSPNANPGSGDDSVRSRLRLSADTRVEQILRAAAREFSRCGYQQARVEDIAASAGLSKGGFYNHFSGKKAVFEALLKHYLSGQKLDLKKRFTPLPKQMDQVVEMLADEITSGMTHEDTLVTFKLLLADGWRVPDVVRSWIDRDVAHVQSQIQQLLMRCLNAGLCRKSVLMDRPELVLSTIVHALVSHVIDPTHPLDRNTVRQDLNRLLNELLVVAQTECMDMGDSCC